MCKQQTSTNTAKKEKRAKDCERSYDVSSAPFDIQCKRFPYRCSHVKQITLLKRAQDRVYVGCCKIFYNCRMNEN